MSQKTTVVLLAMLALASGYTLFRHYGWLGLGEKAPEPSRQGEKLLSEPPPDLDVVRVELKRPDQPDLVLETRAGTWVISEPISAEADRLAVTELMAAFKTLTIDAVFKPADKVAPGDEVTGLDRPLAVLTLTDKSDTRHTLTVGRTDPLSGQSYVRLNDDALIYRVRSNVMTELDVGPTKLRSKRIWDIARDQVRGVELTTEKGRMTLTEQDGRWTITAPVRAAADRDEVSSMLGGLTGLRATAWVEEPLGLGAYGLTNPRITAEMVVQTGGTTTQPETRTQVISFGVEVRDKNETYARLGDEPTVFTVPSSSVNRFNIAVDDLRDKKLTDAEADNIIGITLSGPQGDASLVKDAEGAWRLLAPVSGRADDSAVRDWLDKVAELKADSFDDKPGLLVEQAMADPRLRITLDRGRDRPAVELIVGRPTATGATTFLRNAAYPSVALVRSEQLTDVLVAPMALADKTVLSLREDRIKRVDRQGRGDARTVERIADDWQTWRLIAPAEMDADRDAVRALLDKFPNLKARQQTLLKPGEVGLDDPAVRLTFTVLTPPAPTTQPASDPPATQPAEDIEVGHTLALAEKDGKLYGFVAPSGAVFELEPGLLDDASGELARRALVGKLSSDQAVSLVIEPADPGDRVDLARTGTDADWKLRTDASVEIDKLKVEEVINNLADLRVVRYVTFSATADGLAEYGLDQPVSRVVASWPGPEEGRTVELLISSKGQDGHFYVTVAGEGKVGLATASELGRVRKDWKFFARNN